MVCRFQGHSKLVISLLDNTVMSNFAIVRRPHFFVLPSVKGSLRRNKHLTSFKPAWRQGTCLLCRRFERETVEATPIECTAPLAGCIEIKERLARGSPRAFQLTLNVANNPLDQARFVHRRQLSHRSQGFL